MTTRQQIFEYIQRELNDHTQRLYTHRDIKIAYIYQTGFLQSVLADLCYNDSQALDHFRRVMKRAAAKKIPK